MFNPGKKIAIIGVGLIGGSLGLALKKARPDNQIIGFFRKKGLADIAVRTGIVDKAVFELSDAVRGVDIIVIATPVSVIKKLVLKAIELAKPGALIMDVGSTKQEIVSFINKNSSRPDVDFIGAHPLAGSEKSSLHFAKADLFKSSVCFLVPAKGASIKALRAAKKVWKDTGAKILIFSAREHDRLVCAVSHLPHALMFSLMHMLSPAVLKYSGSGLKDSTRLALSEPKMWTDIFLSNKMMMMEKIQLFKKELSALELLINSGKSDQLLKYLRLAKAKRDRI